jgi:hypothetical protein
MREREKTSNENNEMIPKTTPVHTPKVMMSFESLISQCKIVIQNQTISRESS